MKKTIRHFLADQKGDLVQQALFLVLVVIVTIAALTALGVDLTATFNSISAAL